MTSIREVSKLLGGSALVYAVAAGLPTGASSDGPCNIQSPGSAVSLALAQTEVSGARLKAKYLEGADGSRQFFAWYDTTRGVDCSFSEAADGVWRCLPSGADSGYFFADAACSQQVSLVPKGCAAPAYALVLDHSACRWRPATRVFLLGAPFTGPVIYYWVSGAACAAVTNTDLAFHDPYLVGEEVTASSFVQGMPQVEP